MITHSSFWLIAIPAFITGGMFLKIIELLMAWAKERREQRSRKSAHEKDRPRFRVDVAIVPTDHASVPAAIVEILSLGSLPLTINNGEVFIEASHYPERVQSYNLAGREIGALQPIKLKFPLPQKLVNPQGVGESIIKLICHFFYAKNGEYRNEKTYNRNTQNFE